MKKSLIALAALAAVGAASAQSSVTLYGRVDVGYGAQTSEMRDTGTGKNSVRSRGIMDGANTSNAFGLRGTEDLGGGLKANFVTEFAVSPTSGVVFSRNASAAQQVAYPAAFTNQLGLVGATPAANAISAASTNRQSYVGLSSSTMGTLNVGYQYTNLYELSTLSGYNIGSEGLPGAFSGHTFGQTFAGGTRGNGVTYISPVFAGGFTVRAQFGAGGANPEIFQSTTAAGVSTNTDSRRASLMGQYANGPLSAAISLTNHRVNSAAAGGSRTGRLTQLGASYDFGVAKLAGTYNNGRDGGISAGGAAGTGFGVAFGTNTAYRSYQVGVSAPFGAIVPFVTVGRAYAQTDGVAGRGIDIRQAQVGVRYSLSKRTTAYAFYGTSVDNAAQNAAIASTAASVYRDKKTIVGVAHSF